MFLSYKLGFKWNKLCFFLTNFVSNETNKSLIFFYFCEHKILFETSETCDQKDCIDCNGFAKNVNVSSPFRKWTKLQQKKMHNSSMIWTGFIFQKNRGWDKKKVHPGLSPVNKLGISGTPLNLQLATRLSQDQVWKPSLFWFKVQWAKIVNFSKEIQVELWQKVQWAKSGRFSKEIQVELWQKVQWAKSGRLSKEIQVVKCNDWTACDDHNQNKLQVRFRTGYLPQLYLNFLWKATRFSPLHFLS